MWLPSFSTKWYYWLKMQSTWDCTPTKDHFLTVKEVVLLNKDSCNANPRPFSFAIALTWHKHLILGLFSYSNWDRCGPEADGRTSISQVKRRNPVTTFGNKKTDLWARGRQWLLSSPFPCAASLMPRYLLMRLDHTISKSMSSLPPRKWMLLMTLHS